MTPVTEVQQRGVFGVAVGRMRISHAYAVGALMTFTGVLAYILANPGHLGLSDTALAWLGIANVGASLILNQLQALPVPGTPPTTQPTIPAGYTPAQWARLSRMLNEADTYERAEVQQEPVLDPVAKG